MSQLDKLTNILNRFCEELTTNDDNVEIELEPQSVAMYLINHGVRVMDESFDDLIHKLRLE